VRLRVYHELLHGLHGLHRAHAGTSRWLSAGPALSRLREGRNSPPSAPTGSRARTRLPSWVQLCSPRPHRLAGLGHGDIRVVSWVLPGRDTTRCGLVSLAELTNGRMESLSSKPYQVRKRACRGLRTTHIARGARTQVVPDDMLADLEVRRRHAPLPSTRPSGVMDGREQCAGWGPTSTQCAH
jgi:hypothetical protein